MLLIGSRAVKFHHPFFRQPKDYDFIALKPEVDDFKTNLKYKWKDTSTHEKKVRIRVEMDVPTTFEFELAEHYPSSHKLFWDPVKNYRRDDNLGITYKVASTEQLWVLKRSHICFNIHWKKNISDLLFLKERIDESLVDWPLFHLRFQETKTRVKFKDRNFDIDNSDFFKVSEKMVHRMLPHDNIHYATCFYNKPLFMDVKDDLSKAAMNPKKVEALSHELKIQLIQEETMALAIERYILPSVRDKKVFDARKAYVDTAGRMIYNYLPMFLKFFAADNFLEILDLPINYVEKFFNNVKGLTLPEENIQFAKKITGF